MSNALTKDQAIILMDAHDILVTLRDEEEMELLEQNNPELAEAYYALHRIGYGADKNCKVINKKRSKK